MSIQKGKLFQYRTTIHSFRINGQDYENIANESIYPLLQWRISFGAIMDIFFIETGDDKTSFVTNEVAFEYQNGYYNYEWNQMIQFSRFIPATEGENPKRSKINFQLLSGENTVAEATCELNDLSMSEDAPLHKRLPVHFRNNISGILSLTITTEAINEEQTVLNTKSIEDNKLELGSNPNDSSLSPVHTPASREVLQQQAIQDAFPPSFIQFNSKSRESNPHKSLSSSFEEHETALVPATSFLQNSTKNECQYTSNSTIPSYDSTNIYLDSDLPTSSSLTDSINPFELEPSPNGFEVANSIPNLQKTIKDQELIINNLNLELKNKYQMEEKLKQIKQKQQDIIEELRDICSTTSENLIKEKEISADLRQRLESHKTAPSSDFQQKLVLISLAIQSLRTEKKDLLQFITSEMTIMKEELNGLTLSVHIPENDKTEISNLELQVADYKSRLLMSEERLKHVEDIVSKKDELMQLLEEKLKISESEVNSLQQLLKNQEEIKLVEMEKLESDIHAKIDQMQIQEAHLKEQMQSIENRESLLQTLEAEVEEKLQHLENIELMQKEHSEVSDSSTINLDERQKEIEVKSLELSKKEQQLSEAMTLLEKKQKHFESEHEDLTKSLMEKLSVVELYSKELEKKETLLHEQFESLKEKISLVEKKEKELESTPNDSVNIEATQNLMELSLKLDNYQESLKEKEKHLISEEQRIKQLEAQVITMLEALKDEYAQLQEGTEKIKEQERIFISGMVEREAELQRNMEICEEAKNRIQEEASLLQKLKDEIAEKEQAFEVETTLSRKEIQHRGTCLEKKEKELTELEFSLHLKEEKIQNWNASQKMRMKNKVTATSQTDTNLITLSSEDLHALVEEEINKLKEEYESTIEVLEQEMQAATNSFTNTLQEKELKIITLEGKIDEDVHSESRNFICNDSMQSSTTTFEGPNAYFKNDEHLSNPLFSNTNESIDDLLFAPPETPITENEEDIELSYLSNHNPNPSVQQVRSFGAASAITQDSNGVRGRNITNVTPHTETIQDNTFNLLNNVNRYEEMKYGLGHNNMSTSEKEFNRLESLSQIHEYLEGEAESNLDVIDILVTKTQVLKMRVEDQIQNLNPSSQIKSDLSLILKSLDSLTHEFTAQKDQIIVDRTTLREKARLFQDSSKTSISNNQKKDSSEFQIFASQFKNQNFGQLGDHINHFGLIHKTSDQHIQENTQSNSVSQSTSFTNHLDQEKISSHDLNPTQLRRGSDSFHIHDLKTLNSITPNDIPSNYNSTMAGLSPLTSSDSEFSNSLNSRFRDTANRENDPDQSSMLRRDSPPNSNSYYNLNPIPITNSLSSRNSHSPAQAKHENSKDHTQSPNRPPLVSPTNTLETFQSREAISKQKVLDQTRRHFLEKKLHIDILGSPKRK